MPHIRPLRAAAILAAGVLGLALASPASVAATTPARHVVQLGDSYAAGNGAGTYTERTCWRSPDNYGAQAAASIGASYTNVACSGGVLGDLTAPRPIGSVFYKTATYTVTTTTDPWAQWLATADARDLCGIPAQPDWYYTYTFTLQSHIASLYTATVRCQLTAEPQLNAVTPETTDVFVTIGGNDLGFTDIATDCLALRSSSACKSDIDAANAGLPTVQQRTADALRAIVAKSEGNARVFLVGYPYLVNRTSYGIPELSPTYDAGAGLTALVESGDVMQAAAVASAGQTYRTGTVNFVKVKSAWYGYTHGLDPRVLADNSLAWLVPIGASGRVYNEWVHPTLAGWTASANALKPALL